MAIPLGVLLVVAILGIVLVILGKVLFDYISQIKYQNRLLKALRNLDITALSSTEVGPLCQEIVNVIEKELGYFFGAIALIDDKTKALKRVAISENPLIAKTLKEFSIQYQNQKEISLAETNNSLIQVILNGQQKYTSSLYDIQVGMQPKDVSDRLQTQLGMKGFFIYPLAAKNRVIGVIYFCTLVEKGKLSKFEFDVMDEFTREVARVLDNISLYEQLRETSMQLAQANNKLQQLDKLKDDFVSIASHELRTPMTAIRSYVWMALNRPDITLTEKMKKYLSRTLISTERLINLVNDMLNVSRIEAGSVEITPTAFDIVTLSKDVFDEVTPKSQEKNIHLVLGQTNIPKVFADNDKVHQVLLNLIGNALKFTPTDGSISVNFLADGNFLDTTIKDTGVGISKEDQSKLFRKFERLDNSYVAAATTGGTGLGLYICRLLVDKMGGKIWVYSDGLGKGTAFTFTLPIASTEILSHPEKYTVKPLGPVKPLEPIAL